MQKPEKLYDDVSNEMVMMNNRKKEEMPRIVSSYGVVHIIRFPWRFSKKTLYFKYDFK